MAVQIDYLRALIDRGDLYDPSAVVVSRNRTSIVGTTSRVRRGSRLIAFDTVRALATLGLLAWSIVVVETWLLVTG